MTDSNNLPAVIPAAPITTRDHTAPAEPTGHVTVTPKPWIDPDSHEGALIMLLFRRLKRTDPHPHGTGS